MQKTLNLTFNYSTCALVAVVAHKGTDGSDSLVPASDVRPQERESPNLRGKAKPLR